VARIGRGEGTDRDSTHGGGGWNRGIEEEEGGGDGAGVEEGVGDGAAAPNVNEVNVMGQTPLLLAAGRKPDAWAAKVCHQLLKHRADATICDLTGRTPIMLAILANNPVTTQVF
jgi:hypothetical protein